MAFIILVLIAFFAMIALQQQMTKKGVEAGAKDGEIKMLLSYYKTLRDHQSRSATAAVFRTGTTRWRCAYSTKRARAEKAPRSWAWRSSRSRANITTSSRWS